MCARSVLAVWTLAWAPKPQSAAKKSLWTLGVYAGESPLALQPLPEVANPVLTGADVTDMKVDTLAHPFLVIKNHRYYVFFTAKDLKSDKVSNPSP